MTRVHLIRHGRASANEDSYDKLQPLGETQARLLGEHLARREQRFDRVFVGPLKRQLDTLALMREGAGELGSSWPAATTLAGLEEAPYEPLLRQHLPPRLAHDEVARGFIERLGSAEGREQRHGLMNGLFDHMVELWRRGEVAPELQSHDEFVRAAMDAFEQVRRQSAPGEQVAVVTSNGVIGCILEHTVGVELPEGHGTLKLANTSICVLELEGEHVRLVAHNLTEHLSDPAHVTIL